MRPATRHLQHVLRPGVRPVLALLALLALLCSPVARADGIVAEGTAEAAVANAVAIDATASGGTVPTGFEGLVDETGGTIAIPAGFEDLFEPQLTYVDLYFGGRPIGSTTAIYGPGLFRFEEPLEIISRIAEVKGYDQVLAALSGPLDPNEDKVCYQQAQTDCGLITPQVVGVIYNPDTFRADLFIGPSYLDIAGRNFDKYLAPATEGAAFTSGITGTFSGNTGQEAQASGENQSVLSYGDARLLSTLAYQTNEALYLDGFRGEQDMQDWRYGAGLFDGIGGQFVGDELMYGIAMGTMLDRRLDLGTAAGSEVVLFLPQRAQVEIIKDERVISTAFYDAGNQLIDTSRLPDGSYEITFRITDLNGQVSEETRFFSKSRLLPPLDAATYTLEFGIMAQDLDAEGRLRSLPGFQTNQPLLQLGTIQRLTDNLGVSVTGIGNPDTSVGELGAIFIGPGFVADAGAMWSTDNDRGIRGNIGGSLWDWSANVNAQRIWVGRQDAPSAPGSVVFDPFTSNRVQVTGSLSHSFDWGRFNILGTWNRDSGNSIYSFGPSLQVPLWDNGESRASVLLSATHSNDQTRGDVLFTYSWGNSRTPVLVELSGGGRYAYSHTDGTLGSESGPVARGRVTWQQEDLLTDDRLAVGAGLFRETSESGVEGHASYGAAGMGNLSGAVIRSRDDNGDWDNAYSGNFTAGLVGNLDGLELTGAGNQPSGILISLDANTGDALYDIIVGGQRFGTMSAGERRAIPLTPYNTYEVRLEPITGGFITMIDPPQQVTLYPGNVISVDFRAAEVVPVFGRIVREDGSPVGIARIVGSMDAAITDELGYFQTEMAGPGVLTVQPLKGPECEVVVEALGESKVFAKLGTLTCVTVQDS